MSGRSTVTITFIDGEVREYGISASHKIAHYLFGEASRTGFLQMRDDDSGVSHCVPTAQIRDVQIKTDEVTPEGNE